jgi:hypothetical protein
MIYPEYRSAIFTTSDAQAESAKLVTEEVQAKHFTPKGEYSGINQERRSNYADDVTRDCSSSLLHSYAIALLFYWVITSIFSQARKLSPRFSLLLNGGTPRTIINSTSSRTLADISVQPIDFTGRCFVGYRSVNNQSNCISFDR